MKKTIDEILSDKIKAEEPEKDIWYIRFLMGRGIQYICDGCGGKGTKSYSSTTTWRRGIGGQSLTQDVCDICWGSGDYYSPWLDLRKFDATMKMITAISTQWGINGKN